MHLYEDFSLVRRYLSPSFTSLEHLSWDYFRCLFYLFFKSSHWKAVHLTVKNLDSEEEVRQIWAGMLDQSQVTLPASE